MTRSRHTELHAAGIAELPAFTAAGVSTDAARSFLGPLVEATARNWIASGVDALSGPVARGDADTITRHLELLTGPAKSFYAAHVEAWR